MDSDLRGSVANDFATRWGVAVSEISDTLLFMAVAVAVAAARDASLITIASENEVQENLRERARRPAAHFMYSAPSPSPLSMLARRRALGLVADLPAAADPGPAPARHHATPTSAISSTPAGWWARESRPAAGVPSASASRSTSSRRGSPVGGGNRPLPLLVALPTGSLGTSPGRRPGPRGGRGRPRSGASTRFGCGGWHAALARRRAGRSCRRPGDRGRSVAVSATPDARVIRDRARAGVPPATSTDPSTRPPRVPILESIPAAADDPSATRSTVSRAPGLLAARIPASLSRRCRARHLDETRPTRVTPPPPVRSDRTSRASATSSPRPSPPSRPPRGRAFTSPRRCSTATSSRT